MAQYLRAHVFERYKISNCAAHGEMTFIFDKQD